MTTHVGRRVMADHENVRLEAGDYHRARWPGPGQDKTADHFTSFRWEIKTPTNGFCAPDDSLVTEHEDGTITVSGELEHRIGGQLWWKGTLVRGVFTTIIEN